MADETAIITLTRNGTVAASTTVLLQGPAGGALPPGFQMPALPQGTLVPVVGQTNPAILPGRSYQRCTFTNGPYFRDTSDVEFVDCACSTAYGIGGNSHRVHFLRCSLGHSRDINCQIKPYEEGTVAAVPSDILFESSSIDDVQRTTTGVHTEGMQIGGVQRMVLRNCTFGTLTPNSIFDLFAASWIGVAGITSAPITDFLIDGGTFAATTNTVNSGSGSYAISLHDTVAPNPPQFFRICVRNTRVGQSINLTGNLDPAGRSDVLIYGNTRLDGTPLVKVVAGGFVNYS